MTAVTVGPVWSAPGAGRYAGRYPLAAERHTLAQVDRLLPGVTTVTPHGRYYAVHALVAAEAARRDLSDVEAQTLLRRVEVAFAAVSVAHEHTPAHEGLNRAHGAESLAASVRAGAVDVTVAAGHESGRYAKADWGYWGPYRGAEVMLGILDGTGFRPGEQYDSPQVQPALSGLFDLAAADTLTRQTLDESVALCVCGGMTAPDGEWLARLLVPSDVESARSRAATRRDTIRMVTRVLDLVPVESFTRDIAPVIAYGPWGDTDPVLSRLDVTAGWRGTVLRAESVAAWRALWAWLVRQIEGLTPRQTLADAFASHVPNQTVAQFMNSLPPLRDSGGYLAAAELDPTVLSWPVPLRSLAVLVLGAQRVRDLDGPVLVGFHGRSPVEIGQQLGPSWLAGVLDDWTDRPLPDFTRHLTGLMLDRSQRISFRKATRDKATGQLKVPTRVFLRDDLVFKDSDEGGGPVALRWDQLGTVLAETGTIHRDNGVWGVTPRGRDVLD